MLLFEVQRSESEVCTPPMCLCQ